MSDNHKAVAIIERSDLADNVHPVVRAALAQSPDPQTLRDLLEVQRQWEAGEAKRAFTRALVALKKDLPTVIRRDKTVSFSGTHYTHTSLAAAMEAVTGPLTAHGFNLSWIPSTDGQAVKVTCRLTHAGGHFEEASITAPPDNKGSKSPAQGVASTITLLSRYTALALLGIATADMEEPKPQVAEGVDTERNLKAVAALKKYGKTRQEAEAVIGKVAQEWTAEDIVTLKEWLRDEAKEGPSGVRG